MAYSTKDRLQEIADRGLQDRLPPDKRAIFDEAVSRGLITLQEQQGVLSAGMDVLRAGAAPIVGGLKGVEHITEGSLGDIWSGKRALEAEPIRQQVTEQVRGETGPRAQGWIDSIGQGWTAGMGKVREMGMQGALGMMGVPMHQTQRAAETLVPQMDRMTGEFWQGAGDRVLEATKSPALATMAQMTPEIAGAVGGSALARMGSRGTGQPQSSQSPQAWRHEYYSPSQGVLGEATPWDIPPRPPSVAQEQAQRIQAGSNDQSLATLKLREPGQGILSSRRSPVVKDPLGQGAVKQGWRPATVQPIKSASPETKRKIGRQLDIHERRTEDEVWGMDNRPGDVAGDALMERVKVLMSANELAGKSIGAIAKSLKEHQVNILPASTRFQDALEEAGISFQKNEHGELIKDKNGFYIPDFTQSVLSPGDRGPIKEVIRQMNVRGKKGNPSAYDVHLMKKAIDNNVSFGKAKTGITHAGAKILKDFRRDLDETLDSNFPEYNEANITFKETREAIDSLQDASRNLDLKGDYASQATGQLMRKLMTNYASRTPLMTSLDMIENTANKYLNYKGNLPPDPEGIMRLEWDGATMRPPFSDDLKVLAKVSNDIDEMFGSSASGGIEALTKDRQRASAERAQSASEVARGGFQGILIDAAVGASNKVRGINQENAIKSLRAVLNEEGVLSI